MKIKKITLIIILIFCLILTACSPGNGKKIEEGIQDNTEIENESGKKDSDNIVEDIFPVEEDILTEESGKAVFSYSETDKGLIITGVEELSGSTLRIPSEHDGKSVIAIGEEAFNSNTDDRLDGITRIIIPSSIIRIKAYAFSLYSLTKVDFEITKGWLYGDKSISESKLSDCESAARFLRYNIDKDWTRSNT